ncbi:heparan-alpha-glucosaminide N-acetyltransferase domain-containing protein [Aestuariibacter halophilus]|uniref:Heparan-alpha-glucosaminide N-acetyltransferase domain-containing protein n=1 Tax=Fluctibacter halophilus TaxID=226011 RepID=A0ABS8GA71_9ALTE|nr:heparan-alpha-glucosaminide N-acetyltransferase domain-containing protein [Aestuariibacter halophilus]MCC2617313.1 heparan-alpha-glucosaminide N-acetyltransferase domain-containing protein [Aestuariibacter halophilus]
MQRRERSLDIFRGLTLAAMILVNTPGSWAHIYAPLKHASWHGLTPTDLIFPFFLFIVGAAMFHSMARYIGQPIPWRRIIKRTVLLFAIGVALNIYPFTGDPEHWRIMGVLQRIALAYCAGAILILTLPRQALWYVSGAMLLGYWGLLLLVDQPFSLEHNLVRQVDLTLLGASHLYQGFGVAFDPEGLLSTIPATVTLLMGYLTSALLSEQNTASDKCRRLLLAAIAALAVGYLWDAVFPINKALWSSSYVLVTTGYGWLVLSAIIYLLEIRQQQTGFAWMEIYGTNPLFVYVLAWLYAATLYLIPVGDTTAYTALYDTLNNLLSAKNASLAFALLAVLLFYVVSHVLYKRRIFIKL